MKYEVKLSEDGKFVWQLPQEDITMELAYRMSADAIKLARAKNIHRFLSDVRGIRNISDSAENREFAYEKTEEVGYKRDDKIAVLHDADDVSHIFIETVSLQAGYAVKLFTEMQEALDWLLAPDR